jgi:galactonate dehydratase
VSAIVLAALSVHAVSVSSKTVWVFLRAVDRDGIVGWGEATVPDLASHRALATALERLAGELVGRRFDAPIDLADALGLPTTLPDAAAQSALDQALVDIAARRDGLSIATALGARAEAPVALYANINRRTVDRTPSGFAASARAAQASGFVAFKIAPFDGVTPAIAATVDGRRLIDAGMARAAAVREAIGPDATLMIDCHWRLTLETAEAVLAAATGLRLHWLECAMPEVTDNFAAMRRLRDRAGRAGILTAGCETMIGAAGFAPFIAAGVYDVIMPDVKYVGGVRELMRVSAQAAASGTTCSLHNPSGPICHAHSIQASAAIGTGARLEHQFDESPLFVGLVDAPLVDFVRPEISPPDRGGLGIALDPAVLAAHRAPWPPAPSAGAR